MSIKKSLSAFAALTCIALSSQGLAQFANGNFSNGGHSWDWYEAVVSSRQAPYCRSNLEDNFWQYNIDLIDAGSRGWVASLHKGYLVWTDPGGHYAVCGSTQQQVSVPPGTELVFDYKLGSVFYNYTDTAYDVVLKTSVEASGSEVQVSRLVGRSKSKSCQPSSSCPEWEVERADVSSAWGQTANVDFFAQSRYWRGLDGGMVTYPSPALIDNVRFERIDGNRLSTIDPGMWFNPERSGHGIDVSVDGMGNYMVVWFTYKPDGTPVWYMSNLAPLNDGEWSSLLKKMTWNSTTGQVSETYVGTVEIRMPSSDEMIFLWDLYNAGANNSTGGEVFTKLHGGSNVGGMWFDPNTAGSGFTLSAEGSGSDGSFVSTAYFYAGSEPVWAQGVGSGNIGLSVPFNMKWFVGTGLCPACAGQQTSTQANQAGSMTLEGFPYFSKGWVSVSMPGGWWFTGSSNSPVNFYRLTYH